MFNLTTFKRFDYVFCLSIIGLSCQLNAATHEGCLDFHVIQSEPVGFINEDGLPTGIHWEYLEAIKKHSGLCIHISLYPYARIWESIKNGKHDGGIIFKSDNRSELVEYVAKIQNTPTVVIPLKGIKLKDYSDLKNLKIGNLRGAHLNRKFDNDKNLNIVGLSNYEQQTKMINLKRLDAVAGNIYVLTYQLKKYGVLSKVDLDNQLYLGEKEQWLQLSSKSAHMDKLPILRKSINELKSDGVFRDILLKYYGPANMRKKS